MAIPDVGEAAAPGSVTFQLDDQDILRLKVRLERGQAFPGLRPKTMAVMSR